MLEYIHRVTKLARVPTFTGGGLKYYHNCHIWVSQVGGAHQYCTHAHLVQLDSFQLGGMSTVSLCVCVPVFCL